MSSILSDATLYWFSSIYIPLSRWRFRLYCIYTPTSLILAICSASVERLSLTDLSHICRKTFGLNQFLFSISFVFIYIFALCDLDNNIVRWLWCDNFWFLPGFLMNLHRTTDFKSKPDPRASLSSLRLVTFILVPFTFRKWIFLENWWIISRIG